jgi:hypothetical protein
MPVFTAKKRIEGQNTGSFVPQAVKTQGQTMVLPPLQPVKQLQSPGV